MSQVGKVNDPALREEVVRLVQETGQPVTIDFVAKRLRLSWVTGKALLLDLSLSRQLSAVRTTSGWVFTSTRRGAAK